MFGMADGVVTNVSLILGFAGAHPAASVVRLAGLAGLVAGACSMGTGEYLSMSAQRELIEHELDVERTALREMPEGETEELIEILVKKGLGAEVARRFAVEVMSDPNLALEVHSREELGVSPGSLGSPLRSAASSFVAFSIGAFLPLLPWLLGGGTAAVLASIVLGGAAAASLGGVLAKLTGRPVLKGALRFLGLAAIAAGVTYAIGRIVGTG